MGHTYSDWTYQRKSPIAASTSSGIGHLGINNNDQVIDGEPKILEATQGFLDKTDEITLVRWARHTRNG